ncbi:unnamed protein product [Leuciscus chuanchicus]
MPDNCVLMDNAVGFIREKRSNGTLRIDVVGETDCDGVFEKPCNSKLFNIMFVSILGANIHAFTSSKYVKSKLFLPFQPLTDSIPDPLHRRYQRKVFSMLFGLKDQLQQIAGILDPGKSTSSIQRLDSESDLKSFEE